MTQQEHKPAVRWITAIILFSLIAIVWTRPLYRYMNSAIPYEVEPHAGIEMVSVSPQDCLQLYYKYWLFSESVTGQIPVFSDPYEFAVPGARGFTSQQFPVSALFALIKPIGPAFAYNMILLFSFLACGIFMLKLAYAKTKDWPASFIAGLIFCIMPFRLPQLMAGHPNGVAVCFVPLTLFLITRAGEKHSPVLSLFAGLVFSSIALLDMQLAYFSSMLIALFVIYEAVNIFSTEKKNNNSLKEYFRSMFLWLAPMVIGVAPGLIYLIFMKFVILKASAIHGSGTAGGQIGPAIKDLWDVTVCGEKRIYVGLWVAILAAAGLLLPAFRHGGFREKMRQSAGPVFWGITVIVGIVLSLSLHPPFNRIVDKIPIARLSRTPARAIIITFTGLSLLSAYALASLNRFLGNVKYRKVIYTLLISAVAILIAHSYWLDGPRGLNKLPASSPVYEGIVEEAPDARVLAIPIWPGDSSMSASLFHHIVCSRARLINGYSPVASTGYKEKVFTPLKHVNVGQFGTEEWKTAQDLNITHLTFHPESFPSPGHVSVFPADLTLERLKQTPMLEWVCHNDPIDLFRVNPCSIPAITSVSISSPIGISIPGRYSDIRGDVQNDAAAVMKRVLTRTMPGTNSVFRCKGRIYPEGNYKVYLRLKAVPQAETEMNKLTWTLRTFLSEKDKTVSQKKFSGKALPGIDRYGWVSFPMELTEAGRVGFEMMSSSPAVYTLDLWHMIFSDQSDCVFYEAEDFFHAGRVVSDDKATGRGAVRVNDADPTEGIVRGPYRILAPGKYTASVRLRGQVAEDGQTAATVHIVGRTSPIRAVLRKFAIKDWSPSLNASLFSIVEIPFNVLPEGTIIECRIDRRPGATLEIDSIKIEAKEENR